MMHTVGLSSASGLCDPGSQARSLKTGLSSLHSREGKTGVHRGAGLPSACWLGAGAHSWLVSADSLPGQLLVSPEGTLGPISGREACPKAPGSHTQESG